MPLRSRPARTIITSAVLLLSPAVLAASGAAQSADWTVQRLHAPSSSLARLSQADQAIVLRLLRPELGPLFQGDASSVIDQQIRSFRAQRISLGGVPAVALAPSSGDLCGSNGNCGFWIIDLLHRRVLLRSDAVQSFAVEAGKPHATPNVITRTGSPAGQAELTRWRFSGASYERASCATSTSTDDSGAPLDKPIITPHSCSPEGN